MPRSSPTERIQQISAIMASQDQKPKIILYWLEKSRAHRILWLLEELKLPYELKTYKRVNGLAPPELKEVHPLGKSPILSIQPVDMEKPIIIAESGAMVEYLLKHFGQWMIPAEYPDGQEGLGKETEAWMRYRFYMHYAEGSLMTLNILALIVGLIDRSPWYVQPITSTISAKINSAYLEPNFKLNWSFLETQLESAPEGGPYLCGKDITGADILMSFPVEAGKRSGLTKEKFPRIGAYLEAIEGREAYQTSVKKIEEKFGPYRVI